MKAEPPFTVSHDQGAVIVDFGTVDALLLSPTMARQLGRMLLEQADEAVREKQEQEDR